MSDQPSIRELLREWMDKDPEEKESFYDFTWTIFAELLGRALDEKGISDDFEVLELEEKSMLKVRDNETEKVHRVNLNEIHKYWDTGNEEQKT